MDEPVGGSRSLLQVVQVDAALSFTAPLLIGAVPVLHAAHAPDWLGTAAMLTLAVVAAACGIVMASAMAVIARRGAHCPEPVLRHFRLTESVRADG